MNKVLLRKGTPVTLIFANTDDGFVEIESEFDIAFDENVILEKNLLSTSCFCTYKEPLPIWNGKQVLSIKWVSFVSVNTIKNYYQNKNSYNNYVKNYNKVFNNTVSNYNKIVHPPLFTATQTPRSYDDDNKSILQYYEKKNGLLDIKPYISLITDT